MYRCHAFAGFSIAYERRSVFMGVLACDRKDCDNIMCDNYVRGVGYICWECEREFKDYVDEKHIELTTEQQIINELNSFMNTEKGEHKKDDSKVMTIDDFFNQHRR